LFLDFPVGQPLRVRCQGLVLGDYAGEVSLGATSDDPAYPNGFIARDDRTYYLKPYGEPGEALPDTATFAGLDDRRFGSLVAFERVQFVDEELSLAWCDPDADTNRHLVDCRGDTLVVRTSCRADFAYRLLSAGSGYVEGILSRFNRTYQLKVYTDRNVVMDSPRFVPVFRSEAGRVAP